MRHDFRFTILLSIISKRLRIGLESKLILFDFGIEYSIHPPFLFLPSNYSNIDLDIKHMPSYTGLLKPQHTCQTNQICKNLIIRNSNKVNTTLQTINT